MLDVPRDQDGSVTLWRLAAASDALIYTGDQIFGRAVRQVQTAAVGAVVDRDDPSMTASGRKQAPHQGSDHNSVGPRVSSRVSLPTARGDCCCRYGGPGSPRASSRRASERPIRPSRRLHCQWHARTVRGSQSARGRCTQRSRSGRIDFLVLDEPLTVFDDA